MRKLIGLLGIAVLFGCVKEEIDINELTNPSSGELCEIVVEGYVTSEKTVQMVKLSKPITLDSPGGFNPVNDASVFVFDGDNVYTYESSGEEGVYQSIVPYKGEVGKVYTLNVLCDNKSYTASDSMIAVDSVMNYPVDDIRIFDSHIELWSTQHYFGYDKPVIWTYIERPLDSLNHFPHIELNFNNRFFLIYNHVGSLPQGVFPSGFLSSGVSGTENDTLEIVKMSISDSYYNYLVSYFNVTDWAGGIFSVIPGNTISNVSSGCTGFFYATRIIRMKLTYGELAGYYD